MKLLDEQQRSIRRVSGFINRILSSRLATNCRRGTLSSLFSYVLIFVFFSLNMNISFRFDEHLIELYARLLHKLSLTRTCTRTAAPPLDIVQCRGRTAADPSYGCSPSDRLRCTSGVVAGSTRCKTIDIDLDNALLGYLDQRVRPRNLHQ